MNAVLKSGKYIYAVSFSFYVILHMFFAEVGVEKFVPKFLPFPYAVNYITGFFILAFIVSVLIGKWDKLAALLMALYLFLVIVLIHLPNASDPMEMLNVFRISNMIGGAFMYAVAFSKDGRLSFFFKSKQAILK